MFYITVLATGSSCAFQSYVELQGAEVPMADHFWKGLDLVP